MNEALEQLFSEQYDSHIQTIKNYHGRYVWSMKEAKRILWNPYLEKIMPKEKWVAQRIAEFKQKNF